MQGGFSYCRAGIRLLTRSRGVIDLREAEIEGGELTIKVFSVVGVVNIYVPDTVEVELGGFSVLGANREKGAHRRRNANAPVIRVRGFNLMGGTTVFRVPLHASTLGLAEACALRLRSEAPPGYPFR